MAKKENFEKEVRSKEIDIKSLPISDESLLLSSRLGVSANYINLSKLSSDEVVLDFIKVTVSENKVYKDLATRVTLSLTNAKALRDLLNRQIKD